MKKEALEKFLKKILDDIVEVKIYNDEAPKTAQYPYIVLDSSNLSSNYNPRIDVDLEINIWDSYQNYSRVNNIADIIQKTLDTNSFDSENIVGTFYLNIRKNVIDENKQIKRTYMTFQIELYFKEG